MNTAINYNLKIKKRIQLVHIAANELGLIDRVQGAGFGGQGADDEYHTILRRWNRAGTRQPVTSSLQMTYHQLGELLDFLKALGFKVKRQGAGSGVQGPETSSASPRLRGENASWKKYESSIAGLKQEICDLAKERWGQGGEWELPLNNFCIRFGVKRWQWLDVSHGKAVKDALVRLQGSGARGQGSENPAPYTPNAAPCSSEVPF